MDYRALSDESLLETLRELAGRERRATAAFVACLAELERRPRAVLSAGYTGSYDFCVRDLKLAQSSAYKRCSAAREASRRPEILSYLESGELNLSTLGLIAPSLDAHPELLEKAKGKSKREVEEFLAALNAPRVVPDRVRPVRPAVKAIEGLPDMFTPQAAEAPSSPPPSSTQPARLEFRFEADASLSELIERARRLLWHKYPSGRLEELLAAVLKEYLDRHDPARDRRLVAAVAAAPGSRTIPARISRIVWKRDGGRCAFVGNAARCEERRGLEVDHVVPWALGGRSDDTSNLRLLCRAHNQAEARRIFGT